MAQGEGRLLFVMRGEGGELTVWSGSAILSGIPEGSTWQKEALTVHAPQVEPGGRKMGLADELAWEALLGDKAAALILADRLQEEHAAGRP